MDAQDKSKKIVSPERLEKLRLAGIKGGLAKRGRRSMKKLNELKIKAAMKQRIIASADKLVNIQIVAAAGTHRMVVLSFDEEGKKHIETVRDETRMQNLLDTGVYGEDYLILEGSKPDWKAAEALLDRGFGKANETVKHEHEVRLNLTDLAKQRKNLPPATLPAITDSKVIDTSYTVLDEPPAAK